MMAPEKTRSLNDYLALFDLPLKFLQRQENIEKVTINTDNMTVSNTNLQKERNLAKEVLGFSGKDLETMDFYSKEASFLK